MKPVHTSHEVQLRRGLVQLGEAEETQTVERLLQFLNLLCKWNKVYNLSAIRDKGKMVRMHLLDSISVLPHLRGDEYMADIGSGAGFPGLPDVVVVAHLRVLVVAQLS